MDKHLIICAIRHSSFDDGVGLWDGVGIFRLGLLLFFVHVHVHVHVHVFGMVVFLADYSWCSVWDYLFDLGGARGAMRAAFGY